MSVGLSSANALWRPLSTGAGARVYSDVGADASVTACRHVARTPGCPGRRDRRCASGIPESCRHLSSGTCCSFNWSKPVAITVMRMLILHVRVDHGAEDDVGIGVGGAADDLRRLVDLVQAQVGAAGDVEQDALGALDAHVEQCAVDGLLGGVAAPGCRRSPDRSPSAPSRPRP